jgi:pyruvate,orthophosphate dikinase
MKKYVFMFEDGSSKMQNLLGGKGANLSEMSNLNIPVPPGFIISTEACIYFMKNKKYPPGLKKQVINALKKIEQKLKKTFGDNKNPLLLSVRSGARKSMPGMMETILNIGLNQKTILGLIEQTQNKRFAYDSYRRLLTMYADVVMEKSNGLTCNIRGQLEGVLSKIKAKNKYHHDSELSSNELISICHQYEKNIHKIFGKPFPNDSFEQLWQSIDAVFNSWNGERAKNYRKIENIPDNWGTAVNIQSMVFGNMGNSSATGVAFTRNPSTGEPVFFGEWLPNAQGEDVVAGIRTPYPITKAASSLEKKMPKAFQNLFKIQKKLEKHYRDMQDIEFTIENNNLWILQTRSGKRNGIATIKIALDLVKEKILGPQSALSRINSEHINEMLHPVINFKNKSSTSFITQGLPAGPGAATGQIVFNANRAEQMKQKGLRVILVREETSPEDVHGMFAAEAILTARGGMTSHAALVARGWGKCCIVGCNTIQINHSKKTCSIGKKQYKELDWFTLDGSSGYVYDKRLSLCSPQLNKNLTFDRLMSLCSKYNKIKIRANADNPKDATLAKNMRATGIGLCRTEHMFFNPARIHEVRKMIIADDKKNKIKALGNLLKFQTKDFYEILKSMAPYPVTIRLLDPPLHEFLPVDKKHIQKLSKDLKISTHQLTGRIKKMKEENPMLGHRGCRLGITFPELTEMQTKAILLAANKLQESSINTKPEIMVPLVGSIEEFVNQKKIIIKTAQLVNSQFKQPVDFLIGAMIELPRACLIADQIAKHADFISFGTNDLTQTTFGFSRDDVGSFFPYYIKNNIIKKDPFVSIDQQGVGELIKIAVKRARKINKKIKIGVCGEHGGDPQSIKFFNELNFNYVSCSPFRLPIAYLASAKNDC